ncbi:MAG: FAD-dependent oxidoreductase, partial [Cyanobacteria bacterium J06576_12]
MHVVVIGGGVIGLNQAIALADQFKVTIVANEFAAETNSVLATAMWHIFMLKLKKDHLTEKSIQSGDIHLTWAQVTLEKLIDWANHKNSGIVIRRGVELFRSPPPKQNPAWVGLLQKSGMDFAPLSNQEIANLNSEQHFSKNSDAQNSEGRIQYGYKL